jgi:hypothetical protein
VRGVEATHPLTPSAVTSTKGSRRRAGVVAEQPAAGRGCGAGRHHMQRENGRRVQMQPTCAPGVHLLLLGFLVQVSITSRAVGSSQGCRLRVSPMAARQSAAAKPPRVEGSALSDRYRKNTNA